jgi:hypothetical protein
MKTPLTYGAIMAVAGALFTFVLYFAGFHDNAEKMASVQALGSTAPLAIGITCLILAMREKRATASVDSDWGYGSALGTGVMTGLFASLFGMVTAYAYFAFVNPHMTDVIFQMQTAKMQANGMGADQIERAEPIMRKMMSPVALTLVQGFMGFLFSFLLSLIIAIFFRVRPANSGRLAEPPPLG